MVRQYVGARYVPKFADPTAWTSGTSYEAMTIVTYNNSSYTSKMPVPATVGNPADNPDYWALTGNYNAQVEQYRQETETVSNNLNTLQGQITTVSNNLTTEITTRKNADTTLQNNIGAEATARQSADNTLQGNINSEASTRASADSNLQSQINQIIAPSGEAPSAAEVQNARIGVDGVTYDTLGNAIREQVTDLKNTIGDIRKNLFVYSTVCDGVNIKQNNCIASIENNQIKLVATGNAEFYFGEIRLNNGETYAPNLGNKIPIMENNVVSIQISNSSFDNNYICYFDQNNNYLAHTVFHTNNFEAIAPANCAFCVIRIGKSSGTSGEIYKTEVTVIKKSINKNIFEIRNELSTLSPEVNNIRDAISSFDYSIYRSVNWRQGAYLENGSIYPHNQRICIEKPLFIKRNSLVNIILDSDQDGWYFFWNLDMSVYINSGKWVRTNTSIRVDKDCYFGINIKNRVTSDITVNEKKSSFTIIPPATNTALELNITPSFTFVQGAISQDGISVLDHAKRIRLSEKIAVYEGDCFVAIPNGQVFTWFLLDDNNNIIKKGITQNRTQRIFIPCDCWLNISVAWPDLNTVITPEELTCDFSVVPYVNVIKNTDTFTYYGEKISIGEHKFKSSDYVELSEIGDIWAQACFAINGYLFISSGNNFRVYNKKTGQYISAFSIEGGAANHSNTITVTNVYPPNNKYPYVCVSEHFGDKRIYVIEITQSENTFSAKIVQTIGTNKLNTDVVGPGYNDFAIDFYHQVLYLLRYKLADTYMDVDGNNTIVSAFKMPNIGGPNYDLTDADMLFNFTLERLIYARQQVAYKDGKLYMIAGAGEKAYIICVDIEKQTIATIVPIAEAIEYGEPEGFIFDYDKILIICANDKKVRAFKF